MCKNLEKIGKIMIDDRHYPGQDLYCDGRIEDEILDIVRAHQPSEYGKIIEERKDWAVLYHLSPLRENIVNWVPVKKTDKVLEVGSGCGAITGALSKMAGTVDCIELSRKRSLINAYRHPDCDNVTINLGNFQDIEPELACDYDYIFLIGVFEYGQSYIGGDKPFETFMSILKKHLAEGGRMVIAIENRFGLKYWAGCKEDHLGTYFEGIEGYPRGGGVRTFTRKGLEEICHASGVEEYSFYYPYPDYKFMTTVFSDERLPKLGELSDNMRNFDRDRMLLFDEKNTFDSILQEGMFPLYANSYVLVVGKPFTVKYARFSNDRAPQYAICTKICGRAGSGEKCVAGSDAECGIGSGAGAETGSREVRKIPVTAEAAAHVHHMKESYDRLRQIYEGCEISLNRCELDGDEAVFEYLPGQTLEELLDACLDRNDEIAFRKLFDRYCAIVRYPQNPSVCDYDLIFSNIIIEGDKWSLIDYEWTFDEEYPADEIILRSLYCYGLGSEKRKKISHDLINELHGEIKEIAEKECKFQKLSTGNRMSMVEIRNEIGYPIIPAAALTHRFMEEEHRNRIQIYEDYGEGFSEGASYFLMKGYEEKKALTFSVPVKKGIRALRIDPSLDYCMVTVTSLVVAGKPFSIRQKEVKLNGKLISENTAVFTTEDSNMTIDLSGTAIPETGARVQAELSVVRISAEMAHSIAGDEKAGKRGTGFAWFRK